MKLPRIGLLAVGLTLMLAAVACADGPTPNIDTTIGAKITPEIPSTSVDWAAQPSNAATGKRCTLSGGETVLATSKSGTLLLRRDQGEMAVFWDSRSRRL